MIEIPCGLCRCGCGQATGISDRTDGPAGRLKGRPYPHVRGHKGNSLVGNTYGRLTVLAFDSWPEGRRKRWLCRCECGNARFVTEGAALLSGNTKSCGCLKAETTAKLMATHGHTKAGLLTPTYRTWASMKWRCETTTQPMFSQYGSRGIKVCERWLNSFENFLADMGERPHGLSIDRIDNEGDYTPTNCRWATRHVQRVNQNRMKGRPLFEQLRGQ